MSNVDLQMSDLKKDGKLLEELTRDEVIATAVVAVADSYYEKGFRAGLKANEPKWWQAVLTVGGVVGALVFAYVLGGVSP